MTVRSKVFCAHGRLRVGVFAVAAALLGPCSPGVAASTGRPCDQLPGTTLASNAKWRVYSPVRRLPSFRGDLSLFPGALVCRRTSAKLTSVREFDFEDGVETWIAGPSIRGNVLDAFTFYGADGYQHILIDLQTGRSVRLSTASGSGRYHAYPLWNTDASLLPSGALVHTASGAGEAGTSVTLYQGDLRLDDADGDRVIEPGTHIDGAGNALAGSVPGASRIVVSDSANGVYYLAADGVPHLAIARGKALNLGFRRRGITWLRRSVERVSAAWQKRYLGISGYTTFVLRTHGARANIGLVKSTRGFLQLAELAPRSAADLRFVPGGPYGGLFVGRFADTAATPRLKLFSNEDGATKLDAEIDPSALQPGRVAAAGRLVALAEPTGVRVWSADRQDGSFGAPETIAIPGATDLAMSDTYRSPDGTAAVRLYARDASGVLVTREFDVGA